MAAVTLRPRLAGVVVVTQPTAVQGGLRRRPRRYYRFLTALEAALPVGAVRQGVPITWSWEDAFSGAAPLPSAVTPATPVVRNQAPPQDLGRRAERQLGWRAHLSLPASTCRTQRRNEIYLLMAPMSSRPHLASGCGSRAPFAVRCQEGRCRRRLHLSLADSA